MSSDDSSISKVSLYDDRIVQPPPTYGIVKGASSINSMPFGAQTQSPAQHQYTIQVPNQSVFMDREILWTSTFTVKAGLKFTAQLDFPANTTTDLLQLGRDISLSAFPLHRLTNVVNATINNQNVTFNCDVMEEVLRLVDSDDDRQRRTGPAMLDHLADARFLQGSAMNPIACTEQQADTKNVPNGAWPLIEFILPNGGTSGTYTPFTGANAALQLVLTGAVGNGTLKVTNPQPVGGAALAIPAGTELPVYLRITSTEKLLLSPFIFTSLAEHETGIFGLNNVMLTMTMQPPSASEHVGRILRARTPPLPGFPNSPCLSACELSYHAVNSDVFTGSRLDVQFLDTNWEVPLPSRSMVPFMDYSRYIIPARGGTIPPRNDANLFSVRTSPITLPYIPDLIAISVRPVRYGAGYVPPAPATAEIAGPIPPAWASGQYTFPIHRVALQWANRSGLLSTHSPHQLYDMSYTNGLQQSWTEWYGLQKVQEESAIEGSMATAGGFLLLRPGRDFVLDPGQAPGMVGNFVIQADLGVFNPFSTPYADELRVTVLAINSGFFATVYGTSSIIRGVLSPADVTAKDVTALTSSTAQRLVGGGSGILSRMGSFITHAKEHMPMIKAMLSAAAPHLPEGARGALSALGLHGGSATAYSGGGGGGGYTGGAYAGGSVGDKRARLGARAYDY
jgi:hypothetical protein